MPEIWSVVQGPHEVLNVRQVGIEIADVVVVESRWRRSR